MEFSEVLKKKVKQAINLLQSIKTDEPIEVAYSGGKDSDVILELAKMAGIKYRAIYKNTTIDPPRNNQALQGERSRGASTKDEVFRHREEERISHAQGEILLFCPERIQSDGLCDTGYP